MPSNKKTAATDPNRKMIEEYRKAQRNKMIVSPGEPQAQGKELKPLTIKRKKFDT